MVWEVEARYCRVTPRNRGITWLIISSKPSPPGAHSAQQDQGAVRGAESDFADRQDDTHALTGSVQHTIYGVAFEYISLYI